MSQLFIPSWRKRLVVGFPSGGIRQVITTYDNQGNPILPGASDMATEAGVTMQTEAGVNMRTES